MTKRLNFETTEINKVLFTNLDATFIKKILLKVKSMTKNNLSFSQVKF